MFSFTSDTNATPVASCDHNSFSVIPQFEECHFEESDNVPVETCNLDAKLIHEKFLENSHKFANRNELWKDFLETAELNIHHGAPRILFDLSNVDNNAKKQFFEKVLDLFSEINCVTCKVKRGEVLTLNELNRITLVECWVDQLRICGEINKCSVCGGMGPKNAGE